MLNIREVLTWFVVYLLCTSAAAVEVLDLYQARIPVNSQSFNLPVSVKQQALAKVVKKVTGLADITEINDIDRLLSKADVLMLQSAFETNNQPIIYGSAPYLAVLTFNELAVNQELDSLLAPIWSKNRPEILIWIATEFEGKREILGKQNPLDNRLITSLQLMGNQLGLPLRLPLMDIEDQSFLHPIDVWGLFLNPIEDASLRYSHDMILSGRIEQRDELFSGKWVLKQNKSVKYIQVDDQPTVEDLVGQMLRQVTTALSEKFAIVGGFLGENRAQIEVGPIYKAVDYAQLTQYINQLNIVKQLNVKAVKDKYVLLDLELAGSFNTLKHYLSLDKKLVEESFVGESAFQQFQQTQATKLHRFRWVSGF